MSNNTNTVPVVISCGADVHAGMDYDEARNAAMAVNCPNPYACAEWTMNDGDWEHPATPEEGHSMSAAPHVHDFISPAALATERRARAWAAEEAASITSIRAEFKAEAWAQGVEFSPWCEVCRDCGKWSHAQPSESSKF